MLEPMSAEEPATSLQALYDLVPQAEEIDLREELELETQRRHWLDKLRPLLGTSDGDDLDREPGADLEHAREGAPEDEGEPWRLTDRQVVGMLEHELGAEQVDDGADDGH